MTIVAKGLKGEELRRFYAEAKKSNDVCSCEHGCSLD